MLYLRTTFASTLALALTLLATGCGSSNKPVNLGDPDAGTGNCAKIQCKKAIDCDDGIPCTKDTCEFPDGMNQTGYCRHTPGTMACPAGQFCLIGFGCMSSRKCNSIADCADPNPCHDRIGCDVATAICTYQPLDKDGDGHSPIVCGGDDCDDSDAGRFKCHVELCDGKNNDCTQSANESNAVCPGLYRECRGGMCTCQSAHTCSGGRCQDDDEQNCGACGNTCAKGATCVAAVCRCPNSGRVDDQGNPIPQIPCGDICVDTNSNPGHCGACGNACGALGRCSGGMCTCPSPGTDCGVGSCVDLKTDAMNCGFCANECGVGHKCFLGKCDINCQGIINCANKCPDQACVDDCRAAGSDTAARLWDALDTCIQRACPNFDAPCVSAAQKAGGACRQALVNCQSDP